MWPNVDEFADDVTAVAVNTYDRVLPSTSVEYDVEGVADAICDGCEEHVPLGGRRYKCCVCPDYNLCVDCYDDGEHDAAHAFRLFNTSTSSWYFLRPRNGDTQSNIICNGCNKYIPITGRRYKCWECSDYDLCLGCYDARHHDDDHPFKLFDSSTSSWLDLPSREDDDAWTDITCDRCNESISGNIYKCCICSDYEVCSECYDCGEHDATHSFQRFNSDTSVGVPLSPHNTGATHLTVICDGCEKKNIDRRYKCWICPDYDLCLECYDANHHDAAHPFKFFDSSTSSWVDLPSRENGATHLTVICDGCEKKNIDRRYKCWICPDYDLCLECYDANHHDAAHPFKFFDSSTSSWVDLPSRENGATHLTIFCDGCETNIIDRRYKCWICPDYDLCLECYDANHHDAAHPFKLFDSSTSSWLDLPLRENDAEDLIYCNVCHRDITDMRYKCSVCLDYQLCYVCYENGEHDTTHMFQLFDLTTSLGLELPLRENAAGESGVCCNVCNQNISDMRYKCSMCSDYQLCYICYENGEHDLTHHFTIFDATTSSGLDLPLRENDQTSEKNLVPSFDALNVTGNANQSCTSTEESNEVSNQLEETGNSSQESSSKDKPINNKPGECLVCSELSEENVRLEPCNHKLACEGCSAKMKKCFQCGVVVKERITKDGRIIPATDGHADAEQVRHLESKIAEIEESQSCSICMDRKRNVVFLCGHSACSECADALEWCHMCRKKIRKKISLY